MNTSADLLKELRIDRKAPPPEPTSRRGLWITLGVIVALLALPEEAQATLLSPDTHVNLQLEDRVAHGVFVDWVHQRGVDPAAEGQLRGDDGIGFKTTI